MDFDFTNNKTEIIVESPSLKDQMQHASDILSCQRKLLDLEITPDDKMDEDGVYEVEKIVSHRKKGR